MTKITRTTFRRPLVSFTALAFVQILSMSQVFAQGGFRPSRPVEGVYKDRITPRWLTGNTRFWYRNDLAGKTKEFVLVDAERGTREPAFDHARLAAALSKAAGAEYKANQLPFDTIEFADDGKTVRFTVDQTTWACDLASYICTRTDLGPIQAPVGQGEGTSRFGRRGQGSGRERGPSMDSPDGKWTAFVKDNNACVRSKTDNQEVRLSTDGAEGNAYGMLSWAPGTGEACLAPTVQTGRRRGDRDPKRETSRLGIRPRGRPRQRAGTGACPYETSFGRYLR